MSKPYRVFISSSAALSGEREEVTRTIQSCGCISVAMEHWNSATKDLITALRREVCQCDFLVLLADDQPGAIHESPGSEFDRRTYVEIEFETARGQTPALSIIPLLKVEPGSITARETSLHGNSWHAFCAELRRTFVTKDAAQAGAIVRSNLLSRIRPREQAIVLRNNDHLLTEVLECLQARSLRRVERHCAVVTQ